jgi:6-phosphogluconolactonase (cycloisomerase 2 family)
LADPSGRFLYVTNSGLGEILVYSINPTTGVLAALATVRAQGEPIGIAISRGSAFVSYTPKFAYAANANAAPNTNVSGFSIDPTTGGITQVSGSPFPAGTQAFSVAVEPSGRFAYVANNMSNNVSAFAINGTSGVLMPLGALLLPPGAGPVSVAVDPSGRFVFVADNANNMVSALSISSTGTLTLVGSQAAPTGGPFSVAVDPTGRFVYVASNNPTANLSAYSVNLTTGALGAQAAQPDPGANPHSIAMHPSGRFAYVANSSSNTVRVYSIAAGTGTLTAASTTNTGMGPTAVTVEPLGRFAYVTNGVGSNNISAYQINASNGALTQVTGSPFAVGGTNPFALAVDPSAKFVYVANMNTGNVSVLSIDPSSGALAPITGSPFSAGAGTRSVAIMGTIQ